MYNIMNNNPIIILYRSTETKIMHAKTLIRINYTYPIGTLPEQILYLLQTISTCKQIKSLADSGNIAPMLFYSEISETGFLYY